MNRRRVRVIMRKEWLELRRNKMILFAMILLPLVMVGTVIFSVVTIGGLGTAELQGQGFEAPALLAGFDPREALQIIINDQNMLYLIMTPMLLPIVIGAYSIIGEKETRSLEPLLATPLTTGELVLGKTLAAIAPALVIGWLQFVAAIAAIALMTSGPVTSEAVRPLWLVAILVAMPLLAVLSTLMSMIVSARMSDVRAAQAVAGLVILPVLGLGMSVLFGQIYLTVEVMLAISGALLLIDLWIGRLTIRAFDRENILARLT